MDGGESGAAPSGLWCEVLGPFEVRWHGHRLALGGAKQQVVLGLLVLEANTVVSVDRLLDWVWHDDAEPRNVATLQVYVSNLRRALEPAAATRAGGVIITRRPGYTVELADGESDLLTFESARREGESLHRAGNHRAALAALRRALSLWRGDPLSGLPVGAAATGVIERLVLARLEVVERAVEIELDLGRHRDVVGELQTWVEEHPLNEALRGHLMLALYRSGRQADALGVYRAGREVLVEELGIDPSRELRELEAQILDQDPALDFVPQREDPALGGLTTELRSTSPRPNGVLDLGDRVVALDRAVVTLGRLDDRDIVLDDLDVSRRHAEIRRSGDTFRILDTGSSNGTYVNGDHVAEHTLCDGDTIRLGDIEMTFRSDPGSERGGAEVDRVD